MKKFIPLIVLAVLVLMGVGLFVGKGPQPEIVVPAEKLWKLGPLNITNTLVTSWVVMVLIIGIAWLATRSMKLMPSGLQNFMEAVMSFLLGQVEEIVGAASARRFFTIVATIFIFVIMSNWFGLLPFFNAIGKTEDVGHEIFHELSVKDPEKLKLDEKKGTYSESKKFAAAITKGSSVATIGIGEGSHEFVVKTGETPGQAFDRYVVYLAHNLAGYKITAEEIEKATPEQTREAAALLAATDKAPKLLFEPLEEASAHGGEAAEIMSPTLGKAVYGVDFQGDHLTLLIPYFRGVFSDVNNTLALGLVAFFVIEFWGFQALGPGYLKKFFNLNGIMSFVGILELLSELIRVISFAFRLFGNIFAGEVLVLMLTFLMPFVLVDIIYGLELFVGFIQASVFALLVLVFGHMASESHGGEEHHESHHDGDAPADGSHNVGAVQAH